MKFKFTSKNKSFAEKFQQYIKADRDLDSSLEEKDGKFYVEYSIADYSQDTCEKNKADDGEECEFIKKDDLRCMFSAFSQYLLKEVQYQMNWVYSELEYLEERFYNHKKGHLPPINGAEKMQNALDALGIGQDYEVRKPVVWVQASNKSSPTLEIDLSANK